MFIRAHTVENVNMKSAELKGQCHEIFDFRLFPLLSSPMQPLIMCGKKEWCTLWYPLIILGYVDGLMGQPRETVIFSNVQEALSVPFVCALLAVKVLLYSVVLKNLNLLRENCFT